MSFVSQNAVCNCELIDTHSLTDSLTHTHTLTCSLIHSLTYSGHEKQFDSFLSSRFSVLVFKEDTCISIFAWHIIVQNILQFRETCRFMLVKIDVNFITVIINQHSFVNRRIKLTGLQLNLQSRAT